MKTVIDILYGWTLVTAASIALGSLAARWLGLRLYRLERVVLSFVLGSAVLSLAMFVLCALHLVHRGVLQVLALAAIASAVWIWRKDLSERMPNPPDRVTLGVFLAGFAVFGVVYFFNALAPEVSPDGMAYHLGVVGAFDRAHGFTHLRPTTFSYLPQGVEMLFLFAYEFGHQSAAAMTHFSFLLALPWLALCFGRRFGLTTAGAFAGLLAYASPVAAIDGVSAYNDVALAAAAFGAFYLLEIWRETEQRGALVAAGLTAGFAASIKYTGALVVVYTIVSAAWHARRSTTRMLGSTAAVAASGALAAGPWLLRNWISTGNPVLPVFSLWFANPYVSPKVESALRAMAIEGAYHTARWRGLWESVAHGVNPGLIGPVFLAAPLGLLAIRHPVGRRSLIAAAVLGVAYIVNSDTRFLIPLLIFLAIPLAIALKRAGRWVMGLAALHLVLSWHTVVPLYAAPQWNIREVPVRAALRLTPEDDFFRRRAPEYFVARMVESQTPPGSWIFAFSALPESYTSRTVLVGFQDSVSYNMLIWVMRACSPPDVDECRFHFAARNALGVRLISRSKGAWSPDEIRFWNGAREVTRGRGWRLRAEPDPWDVQLAFDNDPLTFWTPNERVRPGMWIEAQFEPAARVDGLTVLARKSHMGDARVMVLDPKQGWRDAGASRTCAAAQSGAGLRRLAMEELKLRGVGYLVIADEEPIARDFRFNRAAWGLTEIAEYDGSRLYRLDAAPRY
jgi:hypothetical protein